MNPVIAFIIDYCHRHAHPVNAFLHIIGVPAAFAGIYFLFCGKLSLALPLLVVGYFLQYLGHEAQGNEVGEITLIKSILKKTSAKTQSAKKPSVSAPDPALSADRTSALVTGAKDEAGKPLVSGSELPSRSAPKPTERSKNEAPVK
jgi:Protein of unknown function (DUF962)